MGTELCHAIHKEGKVAAEGSQVRDDLEVPA